MRKIIIKITIVLGVVWIGGFSLGCAKSNIKKLANVLFEKPGQVQLKDDIVGVPEKISTPEEISVPINSVDCPVMVVPPWYNAPSYTIYNQSNKTKYFIENGVCVRMKKL